MVSFPIRCSARMTRRLDALVARQEGVATRQEIIQNMVNQFILAPTFLDAVDVFELREPVSEMVTITLSKCTEAALQAMAKEQGVNLSVLMRNILLCGLERGEIAYDKS